MSVLIGCNFAKEGATELCADICTLLRINGFPTFVTEEFAEYAPKIGAKVVKTPAMCSSMLTVGGDGTILKWGKLAAEYDLPLLGVNMGRLGFMAAVEPKDVKRIPEILLGDYITSNRMMLECRLYRSGKKIHTEICLNDIIVSRSSVSKLPEYSVYCGDTLVSKQRADGQIFSTPTGSTAYSLSAGGPILSPDMECIEFTSLCAHTLFNRPMIFSSDQVITLQLAHYQDSKASFSVDGGKGIPLLDGDVLRISRAKKKLRIIELDNGFFGAVLGKLMQPLK